MRPVTVPSAASKGPGRIPEGMPHGKSQSDDARLMALVANGDYAAFRLIHRKYFSRMHTLVRRIVKSQPETDDVLSEVFAKVWTCAVEYQPQLGSPFNWIATIMRRRAIDRFRALSCRIKYNEAAHEACISDGDSTDAPGALIFKERCQEVRLALACLQITEARAIKMAFFSGLTHAAIATELRVPLGTLKARIRRGMRKLQDQLCGRGASRDENALLAKTAIEIRPWSSPGENPNFGDRVLSATSNCIVVLSFDGRLQWMNEMSRRIMSRSSFPCFDKTNLLDFWKEKISRGRAEAAVRLAAEGRASRFSGFSLAENGLGKWWDVVVSPIPKASGEADEILAVFRDITYTPG